MRSRSPFALGAAALLTLAALTGCSSGGGGNGTADMEPTAILDAAKAATAEASGVSVVVTQENAGKELRTDVNLTTDGATGTLAQPTGEPVEIISTADTIYVKGGPALQSLVGTEAAATIKGKWIAVPKDNPAAQSFAGLGSIKDFASSTLTPQSEVTKVPVQDVDGQQAVGLQSQAGTLWVATEGEPYPIKVSAPEGSSGQMVLSNWNEPVEITAPPADQIVPLAELQAAGKKAAKEAAKNKAKQKKKQGN